MINIVGAGLAGLLAANLLRHRFEHVQHQLGGVVGEQRPRNHLAHRLKFDGHPFAQAT